MNIESLLEDQAFRSALQNTADLSEAAEVLNRYGVSVSAQELASLSSLAAEPDTELSEAELEYVSGGVRFPLRPLLPLLPLLPLPRFPRLPLGAIL